MTVGYFDEDISSQIAATKRHRKFYQQVSIPRGDAKGEQNKDAKVQVSGLVKTSLRNCDEDANGDGGNDNGAKNRLDEDGILDLAQSRFLDPNLTVEYLADDVTLLVLDDPGLIFIIVAGAETVERAFLHLVVGRSIVILGEKFPRSEMSMMHTMENL